MAFAIARGILKAGLVLPVLAIVGCTGLTQSGKPAVNTWLLRPYEPMVTSPAGKTTVVRVTVSVVPGLDSDRILTLSGASELNHYTAARWADNLPELTASLVSRTLRKSGGFEVLSSRGGSVRADCDLHLLVEKFYASLAPAGDTTAIQIAMAGRYACHGGPAEDFELTTQVPVGASRMSGIVSAFQQGVDAVMKQLLQALRGHS